MSATCESCGAAAEVLLEDGSLWCVGCDASARHLGYDNAESVFAPVSPKEG